VVLNLPSLSGTGKELVGPIMTPAIAKIGMQEEQQKQLGDRTLLKRWGRAEEVARLLLNLIRAGTKADTCKVRVFETLRLPPGEGVDGRKESLVWPVLCS
jgi:NAD(P)-dependent dehydrogenase (short-subunit alcohol dehydrogenase family)